ncbi:hypothetical protein [Hirschia baltica]|uniref:hypothetical protein n=1 Tax=Hirschia baltica TaxID=2724 RepID=UPI00059E4A22|nr:hypothetical protein [Hirschia baltica]
MAILTKPIDKQIEEIQEYFDNLYVESSEQSTEVFWYPKPAGKVFSVNILIDHKKLGRFYDKNAPSPVKCIVFFPELSLLTDNEFYDLPHIWLPSLYSEVGSYYHWLQKGERPPLFDRSELVICAYEKYYLDRCGVDLFEIMKLVATYLNMLEYWRAGLGWFGGGYGHTRNKDVETILRKKVKRDNLSSTCPAALETRKAF